MGARVQHESWSILKLSQFTIPCIYKYISKMNRSFLRITELFFISRLLSAGIWDINRQATETVWYEKKWVG